MARDDWVVIAAKPGAEYLATSELRRWGLRAYLPQYRRPVKRLWRRYPLFSGYLLAPFRDLDMAVLRMSCGIRREHAVLADPNGRAYRVRAKTVEALVEHERAGLFDQGFRAGDRLTLKEGACSGLPVVLLDAVKNRHAIRVAVPLFGGVPATVDVSAVA